MWEQDDTCRECEWEISECRCTPDLFSLPDLPYAGTSGWSGSGTSESRARRADRDGRTQDRQATVLRLLGSSMSDGMTWKEVADTTGWHHGTTSGALSVLHKTGRICRLAETRNRCKVYVMPEYVYSRTVEPHRGNLTPRVNNPREAVMITERQADMLIAGHDTLIRKVTATLQETDDSRQQAERVIAAVADWLSDYRPNEFGDDYCTPLDVTAFILRKGEIRG